MPLGLIVATQTRPLASIARWLGVGTFWLDTTRPLGASLITAFEPVLASHRLPPLSKAMSLTVSPTAKRPIGTPVGESCTSTLSPQQ
ncbi:hypothetical protein D3C72_1582510 [compost metagenome]